MSSTGTATGAAEHAEALSVDAAAAAAAQAQQSAAAVTAQAAVIAAQAQEGAAQQIRETEGRVENALTQQEDSLAWLRAHAAEQAETSRNTHSALTGLAERQAATETTLGTIMAALQSLTRPASPEVEAEIVVEPVTAAGNRPSEGADAPREAEARPARPKKRFL